LCLGAHLGAEASVVAFFSRIDPPADIVGCVAVLMTFEWLFRTFLPANRRSRWKFRVFTDFRAKHILEASIFTNSNGMAIFGSLLTELLTGT
jgi:hypothetical protein